ncbi:hypothetical protein GH714_001626 [Hevea brasiliensis]|uniref:Uncharacterized protein n=1 Tax=Hevea brasiliensis TaxID=3981 RepID=A0A6A6M9Z8_HEVBR|nr:hypothetical protein GH714_001626 [Hevea brasiliensis]
MYMLNTRLPPKFSDNVTVRRSANYPPSKWSHDFVASLKNEYAGEPYTARVNKLKEEVKMMLESATNPLDQLEIIDACKDLEWLTILRIK